MCDVYVTFDLFSNLLSLFPPLSPDILKVCFYLKYYLSTPLLKKSPSFTNVFLCAFLVAFFLVTIKLLLFKFFTNCFTELICLLNFCDTLLLSFDNKQNFFTATRRGYGFDVGVILYHNL